MDAFARVLREPASLEARRALAAAWEAAGDPRAELIRLQLELREIEDRDDLVEQWFALRKRINALLIAHEREWAGRVTELVEYYVYYRGLIAEIEISVDRFVEVAGELCALAPIQHLDLTGPATRWREFCELPCLAQIVSIVMASAPEFGDDEVRLLANSPNAAGLRWLGFSKCGGIGRAGVEALAASPYLDRVTYVGLKNTRFDPAPHYFNDMGVVSMEPNARGEELARIYGRRPWLIGGPVEMHAAYQWPPGRDDLAADDYGTRLTLSGADGDETRMLAHPSHGYALAVPGHPRLALDPRGLPRYDGVATLGDLPVEVGVRIDETSVVQDPQPTVDKLARAYAEYRTFSWIKLAALQGALLPAGAAAATSCLYVVREAPRREMEYLVATLRIGRPASHVTYLTVRFASEDVHPTCWANLRAALLAHQTWDGSTPQPAAWPSSAFAASDVTLALLPAAWAEAQAKAVALGALGALTDAQAQALISRLMALASTDEPPAHVLSLTDRLAIQPALAAAGPRAAVDVLVRNVAEVVSMHDLRAWCWQGIWALLHRGSGESAASSSGSS